MKLLPFILTFLAFCSCGLKEKTTIDSGLILHDTLQSDSYIIRFISADSFSTTDIYGDLDTRLHMTDSIGNSHHRALKIQEYLKGKFDDYFFTSDSLVVLKLANGQTASYPFWDEINEEGFTFEHYFKNIDYYLLRVQWIEGNCWMLVNRKNGFQKYIDGLPYISNDKKKILAINTDLEAGYSFNGFELYSVTPDSLKMEFRKETKWGPADLKWINDKQFLLKREHFHFDTITGKQENKFDYKLVTIEEKTSR